MATVNADEYQPFAHLSRPFRAETPLTPHPAQSEQGAFLFSCFFSVPKNLLSTGC
jgi:hypothetical protein